MSVSLPLCETVYDASGWETLSDSPAWLTVCATLLLAVLAVSYVCGWRERRVTPRGGWGVLLALRLLALGGAVLMLLGFERRPMTEREEPSRVVLLTDRSASMELPAAEGAGEARTRSDAADDAMRNLANRYADDQSVRYGGFDLAVEYVSPDEPIESESGGVTRLGAALDRVLSDNASAPLAAVVVATDGGWNTGPDPAQAAAIASRRGVPVHTLGVGALRQPPTVGLRDLAAPSRASVGDRFRATVTAFAGAAAASQHALTLSLHPVGEEELGASVYETTEEITIDPQRGVGTLSAEIDADTAGLYELVAKLEPTGRDADPTDNVLSVRVELVDEPTRVLLAAGGPARDYRFLRDQLFRDKLFECDVLLQSATGAVTQDAGEVLAALPSDETAWEDYDVLVALDLDWSLIDEPTQAAMAEWVATRGGGLVVLAGPVYTPVVVRRGMTPSLRTLLPVVVRDDPLAMNDAIRPNRKALPIRLTPAGEGASFLATSGPDGVRSWGDFPGVYASPLPTEAKPGATVLARLGVAEESATPFCIEHHYGAGRVVYLSAAEMWRLRRTSTAWFTAFQAGLLRHASQGRLLGGAAEGSLLVDRQRYDLGETIAVRYLARSPESIPEGEAGYVRLNTADNPVEAPLTPVENQAGVYVASLRADTVGRYEAVYFTPSGQRLTASTTVTLPSLESETLVQNTQLLLQLANLTGGEYIDLSEPGADEALTRLVSQTPSLAETTIELGPPDEQFARRLAQIALAVMACSLLLEWLLRRAWRLA